MLNTAKLAAAATPLATLTKLATLGMRRRGATLRAKLPANSMTNATERALVEQLLAAGANVRVLEGKTIWAPFVKDGAVVWASRAARVDRSEWCTVEVAL